MIPYRSIAAVLVLGALAACSGKPTRPQGAPAPHTAVATPAEIEDVFESLMQGREGDARKTLDRLLKRDPMSANARLLRDSIRRDPQELLGPANYPYSVRPGDTLVALSQRLLGNRLKAYQLLRYNGLHAPVTLAAGQVLRVPGEPPRIEPPRRPETPPPPPARPRPTTALKPAVAPPAVNYAAARQARAAGLAALNGGGVDRAVGLLRRAAVLDPGNPLIVRDLARAERIAATVRTRK